MKSQVTVYMNDQDREDAQLLLIMLDKEGAKVRDSRNKKSLSALVRLLIQRELETRGIKEPTPSN